MIRFIPDNWIEFLLRPLAMTAPNAGVYVEIMAPDFRFVFLLVALLIVLSSATARRAARGDPIVRLTLYAFLAFVLWVVTSGNGRYFTPILLLVGPLLVGWLFRSKLSRSMQLSLVALMLAVQGWAVWLTSPWDAWSQTAWVPKAGFEVAVDERSKADPATYVTLTSPTYSIIAPQFSPDARWINLDALQGKRRRADDVAVRNLFSSSSRIRLVVPAEARGDQSVPDSDAVLAMSRRLRSEGLVLAKVEDCRLLKSASMRPRVPIRLVGENGTVELGPVGFWVCDLKYDASLADQPAVQIPEALAALISKIEQTCPRFFPEGQSQRTVLQDVTIISYPSSDMKLYVYENGNVSYLYYRALNPVQIAAKGELRSDTQNWCDNIPARTGIPWTRAL